MIHVGDQGLGLDSGIDRHLTESYRQLARLVHRLSECTAPPLDVEDQRPRPEGQLLRHDRAHDQGQRRHRRRHVPQRVERAIGRRHLLGLGDDRGAAGVNEFQGLSTVSVGVPTRDRVELVEGPLRVPETTAGHHCHRHADRGKQRGEDQRDRVSDAAGGVFVHHLGPIYHEVPDLTRVQHLLGQPPGLLGPHAAAADRHEHCRELLRWQRCIARPAHEGCNLLSIERFTVAFGGDCLDEAHRSVGKQPALFMRSLP